jgi:formate hydrogenlyase subunit 3/multisubunit Na+/H+ antiporter MnhD subunit
LRRWRAAELGSALIGCGLVILLLARSPNNALQLFGLRIDVDAPLDVLGRVIQVRGSERFPLLLLFISAAILFACAWSASQGWTFVPVGLSMLSVLSAGLMIRPFVFAALAFVAAAAFGALMIQAERSGARSTLGAVRYLVIAVLALPTFLGAGYVIGQASGISDPAAQAEAYGPASTLLIVGFSLLLGAFPLFTWVHGAAKDAPPLATAFLATVGNGAAMFLLLEFYQEFAWFSQNSQITSALRSGGIVLLWLALLMGWAQRSFVRVLACALFAEFGCTLLLLSNGSPIGIGAVGMGLLARASSLGLLSIGLSSLLRHSPSDSFEDVRGLGWRDRWMTIAIGVGGLSLVGAPGTLGFAYKWVTTRATGADDTGTMMLMLFAALSVSVGLARGLMALLDRSQRRLSTQSNFVPSWGEEMGIIVGTAFVFVLGVWPSVIAPLAQAVASGYAFYR